MKENSIKNERSSIEEYVKILEKFSNENVIYGSTVGMTLEKYKDLQLSAEHILSDYKRVLKENEELKNQEETARKVNELLVERYSTSIPVQKIKDKIEELNRKIDKSVDDSKGGLDEEFIEKAGELLTQKRILQELLESEE